jgi:hypothetical protein
VTALLPHLETKWIPSLCAFLCSIDSKIEIDTPFLYPLQCKHDIHIMDRVIDSGKFKPGEVRMVNYCRLFLRVTTISDVATADGKDIDRTMFLGNPSLLASQTKWMKAEQDKPCKASWVLWWRALRLWSDWHERLHRPLGRWLLSGQALNRTWSAYLTKSTNQLILDKPGTYEIYNQTRRRKYSAQLQGTIPHLPSDAYPVSAEFHP